MRESRVALIVLAAVLAGCSTGRAEESGPAIPPGVSASNWIPLGDSYGFAIRRTLKPAQAAPAPPPPTPLPGGGSFQMRPPEVTGELSGYFVVKRPDGWYRLSEPTDPQIIPLR